MPIGNHTLELRCMISLMYENQPYLRCSNMHSDEYVRLYAPWGKGTAFARALFKQVLLIFENLYKITQEKV